MRITLNLLPPDKKKALQTGLVMAYAQTIVFILFLVTVFVSGTLMSVRLMLSADYETLKKQADTASSSETTDIVTSIRQINSYLKEVDGTQHGFIAWSRVLEDLTPLIPADVHLDRITITEDNKIVLTGVAQTRDSALAMLKKLKEQPYLSNVVSPLSNILQRQNVEFDFEMTYQPPMSN